jgi:hypothetical protein
MNHLPSDISNLVVSFLYDNTYHELATDLNYYIMWHSVPSMFLKASLLDLRTFCFVPSPMHKNVPYVPRSYLRMRPSDIWSNSLIVLSNRICKEKIRALKTYKGCVMRWVFDTTSTRHFCWYKQLYERVLKKLTVDHFRHPDFFVVEALMQISDTF